jgi:hypothetical protein
MVDHCHEDLNMHFTNNAALPRFASLSDGLAVAPRQHSWFRSFWMAPFRDVDDRVARLAAGKRAEKAAQDQAMTGALSHL